MIESILFSSTWKLLWEKCASVFFLHSVWKSCSGNGISFFSVKQFCFLFPIVDVFSCEWPSLFAERWNVFISMLLITMQNFRRERNMIAQCVKKNVFKNGWLLFSEKWSRENAVQAYVAVWIYILMLNIRIFLPRFNDHLAKVYPLNCNMLHIHWSYQFFLVYCVARMLLLKNKANSLARNESNSVNSEHVGDKYFSEK